MNHSVTEIQAKEAMKLVIDAVIALQRDGDVSGSEEFDPDLYILQERERRERQEQDLAESDDISEMSYDPEYLYFADSDQDLDGFEEKDA
jgi:hypothetical protein